MKKKISALLAVLLVLFLSMQVCAQELPDIERTGSIKFWMAFDGKALDGGSLTVYRVAGIVVSDGNAGFVPVDALGQAPVLSDLEDPNLASNLAQLAQKQKLPAEEKPIEKGWAVFTALEPGLYVVTQSEEDATDGFDAIHPFLISLPRWEEGTYVYDLSAAPKVPLVPTETLQTVPTEPTDPTTPPPDDPPDIPKAGQLNWPVPVLAVLGMGFFITGWSLRYGSGRKHHEE